MRGNMKDIFAWFQAVPHPPQSELIASFDGELTPREEAKVRGHLLRCAVCRAQLDVLQEGLRLFDHSLPSTNADFSVEAGLQTLLSKLHQHDHWIGESLSGEAETSPLYRHLLSELSIYIGRPAAMQLLQRCLASGRDRLQETIAPVIIGFLGQHTGSAVLANVVRICDQSAS